MNKRGFSIIELMVVISIIGVLAAIGCPQYKQFQEKVRNHANNGTMSREDGYKKCIKACMPNGVKTYEHYVGYCTCDLNIKSVNIGY